MSEEKKDENPLVTVSSILTGENSKLPVKEKKEEEEEPEREVDSDNAEQNQVRLRNKKNEEEKSEEKKISDLYGKSKEMGPVNDQITFKPDDELDKIRNMGIKSEVEVKDRSNFIKRAKNVENEETPNKDKSLDMIPSLDINPNELIKVDKEDGEVDYFEAEKAYELSVFLVSHKFIKKCKNFNKKFTELVKREMIRYEKNLLEIAKSGKFFILYELQVSQYGDLCLTDIATLNAIKSVLLSYNTTHLIIILSDEEFLNKNSDKYENSLVKDFAAEKLANTLMFLNLDSNNEKRVHAFSTIKFKSLNKEFETEKDKLKNALDKPKLRKLFNLVTKEEEKNNLLLDYPCYLAIAANPSIYTKYIPEITSDFRCLIINSIFYMNRYQLCFDAAKFLSFNDPAVIALKIVPPLNGVNGKEAYSDIDEKNTILSSDEDISLNKKIMELAYGDERGNNPDVDIACQYLSFFEEDNGNYYNIIEDFEKGKINNIDIKQKVYDLIKDLFNVFRVNDINNIDTDKFMIKEI